MADKIRVASQRRFSDAILVTVLTGRSHDHRAEHPDRERAGHGGRGGHRLQAAVDDILRSSAANPRPLRHDAQHLDHVRGSAHLLEEASRKQTSGPAQADTGLDDRLGGSNYDQIDPDAKKTLALYGSRHTAELSGRPQGEPGARARESLPVDLPSLAAIPAARRVHRLPSRQLAPWRVHYVHRLTDLAGSIRSGGGNSRSGPRSRRQRLLRRLPAARPLGPAGLLRVWPRHCSPPGVGAGGVPRSPAIREGDVWDQLL
jgi:hypothetical protein